MPSGTEMDILRYIDMEGGETRMGKIKRLLACYGSSYVETICGSLGRHDFIDWLKDGRVKLTEKGYKALGKRPPEEELLQQYLEKTPEPPEEKYRRWLGKTLREKSIVSEEGRHDSKKAAERR